MHDYFTQHAEKVPESAKKDPERGGLPQELADLARDIAAAYSFSEHQPSHVVEAVVATASIVSEAGQAKTSAVEAGMSAEAARSVALTKLANVPDVFTSKLKRYTNSDGQVRSKAPTFTAGYKPNRASEICKELSIAPRCVGEAMRRCGDGGSARHGLGRELDRAAAGAGWDGGEGTRAGSREDGSAGTNGLGNTPSDGPENRGSERSDRKTKLDICFVNPPVTERCNREQWAWLTTRTKSIQEQWVFLKLVNSSRAATYSSGEEEDGRWVVMHHEKLRDDYAVPSPTKTVWQESGLMEAKKDGRFISPAEAEERGVEPKARELRVTKEALEEWTRLGAEGASYRYKAHRRELVRTDEPQPITTSLYDDNGNAIPDLVEDALKVLRDADHEMMLDAIEEAEEAIGEKEGAEARDRLTSLRLAKETIERQVIQSQDGVSQLQNAYEIQSISGRVGFKRGGPQGLLGEVKARAYDIEGYRNYDIKSCHTAALKEVADMLAELGVEIDVSPWTDYAGKDAVVADTGLPRSLVKVVEHAVKYGAVLPASMEQVKDFYVDEDEDKDDRSNWPSIAKEAKQAEEKGLIEDVDQALRTLHDVFAEMRKVVVEMAEALLNEYYDANHSGGWMTNACGVSFGKHTYDEGHEQRSKVMAWMLPGLEAAFCHHLTILSAQSEAFSVVANEHDGLIIRKEVEDEEEFQEALQSAIQTARDQSGFHRADLVEKDFADEEDVEELYGAEEAEEGSQEQAEGKTCAGREAPEAARKAPTRETAEDRSAAGRDPVVQRHLDRKERIREGDVPFDLHDAKEAGFSTQEWKAAHYSP